MCEAVVFVKDESGINVVMNEASFIRSEGNSMVCTNIVGERLVLEDMCVLEIDLLRHRLVLERV
jgi:predicted RNA-binding protein